MAGNKRPRKPMQQRPALTRPINVAIHSDQARNLHLIPHQELAEIREGRGTAVSWNTCTCRLNLGYVLANIAMETHDLDPDPRPAIRQGLDAMVDLQARHKGLGRYVATGDELKAIGEALNLTDELQSATTRRQQRDALQIVLTKATY